MKNDVSGSIESLFEKDLYSISNLDDEIKSDHRCQELLKKFLQFLLDEQKIDPLDAGTHARGADYFLRDFIIDRCRTNILELTHSHIEAFAGNWYIVKTLEPNMEELKDLLSGVAMFVLFCQRNNVFDQDTVDRIQQACLKLSYYQERIDQFHALKDNEFHSWNNLCPID